MAPQGTPTPSSARQSPAGASFLTGGPARKVDPHLSDHPVPSTEARSLVPLPTAPVALCTVAIAHYLLYLAPSPRQQGG